MLPGEEKTGSITLSNDGTRTGTFQFAKTGETNTAGTDEEACSGVDGGSATCSALGGALKVEVKDGSTVVYDGLVTGIAISDFNLAPAATRTLDFRFYLPRATGNPYQGGSYGVQYNWNEVQPNPAVNPVSSSPRRGAAVRKHALALLRFDSGSPLDGLKHPYPPRVEGALHRRAAGDHARGPRRSWCPSLLGYERYVITGRR